ncbi:hypothetical protein GCM10023198_44760 [Promicromonospora umidemergens]|uniref:Uncharacterized protein n=1 Tax=Promicromonospora umidemergens TaxID=629679 RepID=A0ABP8XXN1_9MICO
MLPLGREGQDLEGVLAEERRGGVEVAAGDPLEHTVGVEKDVSDGRHERTVAGPGEATGPLPVRRSQIRGARGRTGDGPSGERSALRHARRCNTQRVRTPRMSLGFRPRRANMVR